MSDGHEMFLPDDSELLNRLETQLGLLRNEVKGKAGLKEKVDNLETEIQTIKEMQQQIKELIKSVRIAIIFMGVGALLLLLIMGFVNWKEVISILK